MTQKFDRDEIRRLLQSGTAYADVAAQMRCSVALVAHVAAVSGMRRVRALRTVRLREPQYVGVAEAKARFAELLRAAENGARIVIRRQRKSVKNSTQSGRITACPGVDSVCRHGIAIDGVLRIACAESDHAAALIAALRRDPSLLGASRPGALDRSPVPLDPEPLRQYLRDLIESHGITQAAAGKMMGVAARTVRAWLTPWGQPSARDAVWESVELLRRRLADGRFTGPA